MTICSLDQYRSITRDRASADADVTEALGRAQKICEERTERLWELMERTETLEVRRGGFVYPTAYPIQSVSAPTGSYIDGCQIYVGSTWQHAPNIFQPDLPIKSDTTYVGGYSDDDMPTEVREAVAELAFYKLNPPALIGIPAGATSVGTTGQALTGRRLAGASGLPAAIAETFRRWRHVEARSVG